MENRLTAEQVLETCGVRSRPVPLEKILQYFRISQVDLPANNDIFGAIVGQHGHAIIAVNPNQHPNRQRFTIAHELGHYFRHLCVGGETEFVDGDFRLHWRNGTSSQGIDWNEIEANRFAACLLMPEDLVREDVDKCSTLDQEAIQHLAAQYSVSRLAMQYRLINLGILPPDVDPSAPQ
jgi:Zn-dependent peptidase ImmA (M78 family)